MSAIDTPRDPPGLNEIWSDEISALLSQWGEVALCYSWLHNYSQRKYMRGGALATPTVDSKVAMSS